MCQEFAVDFTCVNVLKENSERLAFSLKINYENSRPISLIFFNQDSALKYKSHLADFYLTKWKMR